MPDDTTEPKTGAQQRARWWVWLSLVGSAFGVFSVFNDLIPNLVRLSLAFKAAVSLYRQAREALWEGAVWLFSSLHIRIPDIPDLWKDGIVVGGLVLAALNWESVRRYGQSLIMAFLHDFAGQWVKGFGGQPHARRTLLDPGGDNVLLDASLLALGSWLQGILLYWCLRFAGVAQPDFLPALGFLGVPLTFVYGVAVFASFFVLVVIAGRSGTRPTGIVQIAARLVLLGLGLMPMIVNYTYYGVKNGWRAVALAVGLVVALVGVNLLLVGVVDPVLADPPLWLRELVDADPQALRD